MTEQFFKAIEVEPKSCITSGNFIDSELFFNCDKQKCISCKDRFLYPTITSDHILKLEELILRVLGKGKIILYFDYSDDGFQGYAYISIFTENQAWNIRYETRQEALLELILKLIEANILTKEEVRKVF